MNNTNFNLFTALLGLPAADANLMQLKRMIKQQYNEDFNVKSRDELYFAFFEYAKDKNLIQEAAPIISASKITTCNKYNLQYLVVPIIKVGAFNTDNGNPLVIYSIGKLCYNHSKVVATHHPVPEAKYIEETVNVFSQTSKKDIRFVNVNFDTFKDIQNWILKTIPQKEQNIEIGLRNYCYHVLNEQEKIPFEPEMKELPQSRQKEYRHRIFQFAVFLCIKYCEYVLHQTNQNWKYKSFSVWFPEQNNLYAEFDNTAVFDEEYYQELLLAFQLTTPPNCLSTYGTAAPKHR